MKSSVIYRGPSLIDGSPIVAVAVLTSDNGKTGDMVQTYILRADMDPRDANRTGADLSICGNCPHRGKPGPLTHKPGEKLASGRTCYVVIGQGPVIVYKGLLRNLYPDALDHDSIKKLGSGRTVRIGTYGDGAAVPAHVWRSLISESLGHTGYSHQMHWNGAAFDPSLYMVSADSEKAAKAAWSKGFRTFRIVSHVSDLKPNEISCPASAEAGKKTTCVNCKLCGGTSTKTTKSIAIVAHGSGSKYFGAAA
jgi:hypothetical protein